MITAQVVVQGAMLQVDPNEILNRVINQAMTEAVFLGVRLVKGRTPQGVSGAQGGLLASIQGEVTPAGVDPRGIIGTASPYGPVVEKGRKPGSKMPPKGVLVRWIEVKLGVSAEKAKEIELPMRRSIAKKGTKGAEMFAKTWNEDLPALEAVFFRYGLRLVKELAR